MTNELKPCPFCGGEAEINFVVGGRLAYVKCQSCGLFSQNLKSKKDAIEAWNTRYERTCNNVASDKRTFECSSCGYYYPDLQDFKHCPECGARIIGDDE